MCEQPSRADRNMVSSESHQSQELLVPSPPAAQAVPSQELPSLGTESMEPASPPGALDRLSQGPVSPITVLTLLDKLVNMLDTVQDNQHKMEVRQVDMEGVVRGIQADMTKLSKCHSHTANTVSKLLDKSRKVSVTMKEVRDKMERQGIQVKKLEANHTHLIHRNNFKVLIFQEENEIPSTVFVKDPPPFPRDAAVEGGEELAPGVDDGNRSLEGGLHNIDLSSDEDVGLEGELEEEEAGLQDLENIDKSRADKIKRSSLKKVDSLKKAFSRQNIEKKMMKMGNKMVSAEQREKIKQKTSSLKVSPVTFSFRKHRGSSDSHPPEALAQTGDLPGTEAHIELSPLGRPDQELPFTEVHAQLNPAEQEQKVGEGEEKREEEKMRDEKIEEEKEVEREEEKIEEKEVETDEMREEGDVSTLSEGVSEAYALSATLPQEEKGLTLEEEEKGLTLEGEEKVLTLEGEEKELTLEGEEKELTLEGEEKGKETGEKEKDDDVL